MQMAHESCLNSHASTLLSESFLDEGSCNALLAC
jgi:hypothetical protein